MFLYNNFSAILLIYMIVKNTLTTNLLYLILKHQHCTCIEIKNLRLKVIMISCVVNLFTFFAMMIACSIEGSGDPFHDALNANAFRHTEITIFSIVLSMLLIILFIRILVFKRDGRQLSNSTDLKLSILFAIANAPYIHFLSIYNMFMMVFSYAAVFSANTITKSGF